MEKEFLLQEKFSKVENYQKNTVNIIEDIEKWKRYYQENPIKKPYQFFNIGAQIRHLSIRFFFKKEIDQMHSSDQEIMALEDKHFKLQRKTIITLMALLSPFILALNWEVFHHAVTYPLDSLSDWLAFLLLETFTFMFSLIGFCSIPLMIWGAISDLYPFNRWRKKVKQLDQQQQMIMDYINSQLYKHHDNMHEQFLEYIKDMSPDIQHTILSHSFNQLSQKIHSEFEKKKLDTDFQVSYYNLIEFMTEFNHLQEILIKHLR